RLASGELAEPFRRPWQGGRRRRFCRRTCRMDRQGAVELPLRNVRRRRQQGDHALLVNDPLLSGRAFPERFPALNPLNRSNRRQEARFSKPEIDKNLLTSAATMSPEHSSASETG